MATDTDSLIHARQQAQAQYEHIADLMRRLNAASDSEEIRDEVYETPLSVTVRSGWHTLSSFADGNLTPQEYEILLCTGGPAVRIRGNVNGFGEPEDARLECQDWGTPWTLYTARVDHSILLDFARQLVSL